MLKQSPSPLKRLSILVNPQYSPSNSQPSLFEYRTPSPFYPSPEPLSPQSSILEHEPPAPRNPRSKSLFFAEGTPSPKRSARPRPKSYGGALTVEALELVLDFESRIAEMESKHSRVCTELEETRDALSSERAVRRSSNRFSTLSHARFSSSSTSSTLFGAEPTPPAEVNDIEYERRLRNELQETLKKIRAQSEATSRALRQQEDACSSLASALEEERVARKAAEQDVAQLSTLNLTLFEHNRILAGRDALLQEDISALMTKAQAEECMRAALEAELRRREAALPVNEPTFDAEFASIREELDRTFDRLVRSDEECAVQRERVSALQQQLVMCADSSSQAIEVERELRSDMAEHARVLADENAELKEQVDALQLRTRLNSLEDAFPDGHAPSAWIKRSPGKRRPISGRLDKKLVLSMNHKSDTTDRILERYRHVATSKKARDHRKRRLIVKRSAAPSNTLSRAPSALERLPITIQPPVFGVPTAPELESACSESTKVSSPIPSQRQTPKRSPQISVMLAATLSNSKRDARPQPALFNLKATSSIYVDVNCDSSRLDESVVPKHVSPVKPKASLRSFMLGRATAMLTSTR